MAQERLPPLLDYPFEANRKVPAFRRNAVCFGKVYHDVIYFAMTRKRSELSGAMSKAEFEVLAHFRYQLRRFLRFSEKMTRGSGITPLHYLLMLQIRGYPGRDWATVAELAERLQAKHHGVVALVSRCESAGLVARNAGRDDKRRVEVELTAKGCECLEQLAHLHRLELLSLEGGFVVPDLTLLQAQEPFKGGNSGRCAEKKRTGRRIGARPRGV